jgi:hypothetical protein
VLISVALFIYVGESVLGIQSTEVNIFHVKVKAAELKGVDCAVCEIS